MRTRNRLLVATMTLIVAGGTSGFALATADPKASPAASPAAKGGPSACSADGLKSGAPGLEPAQPVKKPGGSISKPGAPQDKPDDGKSNLFDGPAPDLLAEALGIPRDRAVQVAHQIEDLAAANNGISVGDAKFAAIAAGVGKTSAELRDALNLVKRSLDCSSPDKKVDGRRVGPDLGSEILAAALGVTKDEGRAVQDRLEALAARENGLHPDSPAFAEIAASVGKTPAELKDALNQLKQAPK
ncbi:hypothetical protein [Microbispora sp. NPDC049125]|uniref:hypothetical protein n=1 Tax=Microbispora sp. NPDC049125 TaxID=3154929 RepID=UPI0034672F40